MLYLVIAVVVFILAVVIGVFSEAKKSKHV
jgi:hypothetical protein